MRYLVIFAILLGGCKATLESGYSPRPLKDNSETRRAYYAPAFSPESHAANSDENVRSPVQPMPTNSN